MFNSRYLHQCFTLISFATTEGFLQPKAAWMSHISYSALVFRNTKENLTSMPSTSLSMSTSYFHTNEN